MVETARARVELSLAQDGAAYRIALTDRASGRRVEDVFPAAAPTPPDITGWEETRRCGERVYFLTVRHPPPAGADIRAWLFETLAFQAETLAPLGAVPAPFEDIAPHGPEADLGFAFELPQPYQMVCDAERGALHIEVRAKR